MAMNDEVDRRLHNWARWVLGGGAGGMGYASVRFMSVPGGGADGAVVPTNAVEASETHDDVMRLPSELRRTLEVYYFETDARMRVAERLCCAVSTVDARLTRAHRMLSEAVHDRAARRKDARDALIKMAHGARP